MLQPQSEIVFTTDTFELHAPYAHANPMIKPLKYLKTMTERCSKVIRRSPDHLVKFINNLSIQIMATNGQVPDFVFELLH